LPWHSPASTNELLHNFLTRWAHQVFYDARRVTETLIFNLAFSNDRLGILLREEEIQRLEQIWLVLSDLFQDLSRNNISVNVASDLRDCKTLLHFIRRSVTDPPREPLVIDDSLRNLLQILGKIRSGLVSGALRLDENYVKEWMEKIDKAERAKLDYAMIYTSSEFVTGLPKGPEEGWTRLSLKKPVAEERVQDVAEQFGVIIEFQDDFHLSISGRRDSVRKATRDVYKLSLEEPSF